MQRRGGGWIRWWGMTLWLGGAWAGAGVVSADASVSVTGVFSGRVWIDADRDGLQEAGESGLAGCPIQVIIFSPRTTQTIAQTGADGHFSFTYVTNRPFAVWFDCGHFGVSPAQVGTNDLLDSDHSGQLVAVDAPGLDATGMDLGLYPWSAGVALSFDLNGFPAGGQVQVAEGEEVTVLTTVRNTGEVCLASVLLFDEVADDDDAVYERGCPGVFAPGETIVVTNRMAFDATLTNRVTFLGMPSICHSCAVMEGYPLVVRETELVVAAVTNDPLSFADGDPFPNDWEMANGFDPLNFSDPQRDGDGDGWTDYEEYLAGTDPGDGEAGFPAFALTGTSADVLEASVAATTTARLYRVWVATNLVGAPQAWAAASAERYGSGSNLVFTLTNPAPVAVHRIGVRVP